MRSIREATHLHNHKKRLIIFLYINDIKFAKNEKELETDTNKKNIQSGYRMEFGIEKYGMLTMKRGKRQITERIELPNQERIRTVGERENYKQSGILGSGHHQTSGDERKKKDKLRRMKNFTKPISAAEVLSKE